MDGVVAVGADHEGLASTLHHSFHPFRRWRPRLGEVGQFGDVVDLHLAGLLTQLTPSVNEPEDQLFVSDGGRSTGAGLRSIRTALRCRRSGTPPNVVVSGFLPGRSTLTWKHLRGPCGVAMVA